jgi:hypothetical protein
MDANSQLWMGTKASMHAAILHHFGVHLAMPADYTSGAAEPPMKANRRFSFFSF